MQRFATGLLLCLLIPGALLARFSVTPFILDFVPSENKTTKFIEVYHLNESEAPVPVELSVQVRDVTIDGEIVYHKDENASGDFVIYPERLILYPEERQKIQIKWVGNPDSLLVEKVYAIMATEVELDEPSSVEPQVASGQLTLRNRYAVLAVMKPRRARPEVLVDSIYQRETGGDEMEMVLVINNSGTGMQKLPGMVITALHESTGNNKDKKMTYRPELTREQTKNSLFPGQKRRFVMPWPENFPTGKLRAVVSFDN